MDRLTRLWVRTGAATAGNGNEEGGRREWRLALEGFGSCAEFSGVSSLFGSARVWHSVTPFLPTAHLKRSGDGRQARHLLERGEIVAGALAEATGYPREVRRLLQRRGMLTESLAEHLQVAILPHVIVHGAPRRALQFHRFRSRGREKATDAHGTLLRLRFPEPITGLVASGVRMPLRTGPVLRFGNEGNVDMSRRLTPVTEYDDDGYVASCPEFDVAKSGHPGASNTHGNPEEVPETSLKSILPKRLVSGMRMKLPPDVHTGLLNRTQGAPE